MTALETARHEAGLTQRELAAESEVHWLTISKLERGETARPHADTAWALADILEVDIDELFPDGIHGRVNEDGDEVEEDDNEQ